jgi:hypothetical protein
VRKERRQVVRTPPKRPEFRSTLGVKLQPDGSWTLGRDLVYASVVAQTVYRVPKGFNTDFASVPRLPFVYLMTGNTAHAAAVVHDFLYRTGAAERTLADAVFREAMEVTGVPAWRRNLMWLGVRAAGRKHHVSTTAKPENVAAPMAPASTASQPLGD